MGGDLQDSLLGGRAFAPPPPSFFAGFTDIGVGDTAAADHGAHPGAVSGGIGQGANWGMAALGHALTIAGDPAYATGQTDSEEARKGNETAWEKQWRDTAQRLTPKPGTVGTGTQMVMGLASFATELAMGSIAGPVGGASMVGLSGGYQRYHEAIGQGVDPATAEKLAISSGATDAAFAALPVGAMGKSANAAMNVMRGMAVGGAANVGIGMVNRYADNQILARAGYPELAEQYSALDGISMLSDAAMGVIPPGMHGIQATMLRKAAAIAEMDGRVRDAASAIADARAARQRSLGVPITPEDAAAHAEADRVALEQTLHGDAIDLSQTQVGREGATFISRPQDAAVVQEAKDTFQRVLAEQLRESGMDHTDPHVQQVAQALGLKMPEAPTERAEDQSRHVAGETVPTEQVKAEQQLHAVEPEGKEPEPTLVAPAQEPAAATGEPEAPKKAAAREKPAARDARIRADYEAHLAQGYVYFSFGKGDLRSSGDGKTIEIHDRDGKWRPAPSAAARRAAFKAIAQDKARKAKAEARATVAPSQPEAPQGQLQGEPAAATEADSTPGIPAGTPGESPAIASGEALPENVKTELRRMADNAGWAEIGGQGIFRTTETGGVGEPTGKRTSWIPRERWFQEEMGSKERLPGGKKGTDDYPALIQKGLAGGKLSAQERRTYGRMLEIAQERIARQAADLAEIDAKVPEARIMSEPAKMALLTYERARAIDNDAAVAVMENWDDNDPQGIEHIQGELERVISEAEQKQLAAEQEPESGESDQGADTAGEPNAGGGGGLELTASPGEDELRTQRAHEIESLRSATERRWAHEDRDRHPFTLTGSDRGADFNVRQSDLMDQIARENPDAQVIDQSGKAMRAEDAIERIDQLEEQANEEGANGLESAVDCFLRSM